MNANVQLVKTLLKYTYGLVPIIAGLDKFTNLLTDWSQYISLGFAELLPFETSTFMMIVGVRLWPYERPNKELQDII